MRIIMMSMATVTFSSLTEISSFVPIGGAPEFSTDLSSKSPNFVSNISFIVQSSINGYSVHCEDGIEDVNCTINIEGELLTLLILKMIVPNRLLL